MWNPFSWFYDKVLKNIGKALFKVFGSKEALAVMQIIMEKLLPEAKPIVEAIRAVIADPAKATVQQIYDIYKQFGKEIAFISDNAVAKQNALLNLATELLDAALPAKYATPLLHSAIELALSGIKAEE